jgi:hypothetical protein
MKGKPLSVCVMSNLWCRTIKTFCLCWRLQNPFALPSARAGAKFAAGNLSDWKSKFLLLKAAEANNKKFFIDLGKMLSGDLDSTFIYPEEFDIARVLTRYPSISEKDALRELEKLNPKYKQLKLGTFRVKKGRILRRAAAAHEAYSRFVQKAMKQA